MTRYGKMILDLINESDRHLTAEEIFFQLKKTEPRVVLATVYNNLNALCSEGLIRKISLEGSPDRYDRTKRHDHLVCRRCKKLADICFGDLTAGLEKNLGQSILSYDLKVFYICPRCRNQVNDLS